MTYNDRVGVEIKPGDFVVYVTLGDRHPSLEFGRVVEFTETKSYGEPSGRFKIKIQRSDEHGNLKTKTAIDVAGHWKETTPSHVMNHRYHDGKYYSVTRDDYDEYYVSTTYRDTGKPDTTTLDIWDGNNNRLMVVQPV